MKAYSYIKANIDAHLWSDLVDIHKVRIHGGVEEGRNILAEAYANVLVNR